MKIFENENKLVMLISSLLVIAFIIVVILTVYEYFWKKDFFVIKKIIANEGLTLNKNNYYVALNSKINLKIDNPNSVKYKIEILDDDVIKNKNNILTAINFGYSDYKIKVNDYTAFEGRIYVVKGLANLKNSFDKSKEYVSCNEFSDEENIMLDNVLQDRINDSGYATRAGVVAAARFLTLEFDRRIAYFYENGRLNNYGEIRKVDGEGRYYHKGLYLSASKYQSILNKFTGPGSWGCKIKQFEDAPHYGFTSGVKKPNGFDCSGFISWVLYNGGFDVKDSGAGDIISRTDDLYDLGEKRTLNQTLLNSKEIKVGDLIAYSGHMAIIAGIDDKDNYYVAESLPQYKGVVLNKYNEQSLKNTFTHIILMDSVYEVDGNLTNMWY